ncbi:MAG: molybdopterin-dependent oxidoreductase, partial [Acidobacteriaceae bacterium]|nr:molybdopterin-dependent oxidoreductase [Acidobacteriaceae bacterium]
RERGANTVIVLENDLYRRAAEEEVTAFFNSAQHVIVLDHVRHATTVRADIVLPAGTYAETDGTLVNNEGRAQRFFQAFVPGGEVRASWRWLAGGLITDASVDGHACRTLDEIISAMVEKLPELAPAEHAAASRKELGKIAREPNRYSGRTAMLANITVHEPKPADDPDSPLAFSMEAGPQQPPSSVNPFFWAPGWNSIQSVNKFQSEVGGPLRGGDPGVRLIEPSEQGSWSYFTDIPGPFRADGDGWLLVPSFHIFGSEELSRHAPAISQLTPEPYIALSPADAALLGVKTREIVAVGIGNAAFDLPVSIGPDIPRHVAVAPVGMPPLFNSPLPVYVKLAPAASPVEGVSKT